MYMALSSNGYGMKSEELFIRSRSNERIVDVYETIGTGLSFLQSGLRFVRNESFVPSKLRCLGADLRIEACRLATARWGRGKF